MLFICFAALPITSYAQTTEPNMEQQIENITQSNDDNETEDDSYLQDLQQFIKHPININTATEDDLKELKILSPNQIQSLITYRRLFGLLVNIYELQAVPFWDVVTINKIKPFIVATNQKNIIENIAERLSGGNHTLLLRLSQNIEKSKGFLIDTTSSFYPGSPQKLLVRYKYTFKNLLQYGIVADKDAGEQFFKGNQKQGFDFYSAHFFARNMGIVKSLAIGDFTVNMGQGLTQWQSLAFKKSADVMNIKRQSQVLRPYSSAGEIYFNRGVGITLKKKNWETTMFASYKKIDANFVADTLIATDDYVSSLQTTGYHRTKNEVADKGVQHQLAVGGNITYQYKNGSIGINAVQYQFKLPIQKSSDPYNLYDLSGKAFGNSSIDYSYTFKNLHFFGEAAITNQFDKAFINGLMISTSAITDMSFVYRNISKSYQSLYTNAFTQGSSPTNEKGMYAGLSLRPSSAWQINMYADFFKNTWLRYRVNAPANGTDYLFQILYKPNKVFEVYSRFRSETKSQNYNPNELPLHPLVAIPRQSWRTQFSYKVSDIITCRSRAEFIWYDKKENQAENGALFFADMLFKPMSKPFSGNLRLQYFETDGYNSRLYTYENDMLYNYSVPLYYDKGFRYYINFNYDFSKKTTAWIKWGQTIYADKNLIGSGLDEINGNKKSELKLQVLFTL